MTLRRKSIFVAALALVLARRRDARVRGLDAGPCTTATRNAPGTTRPSPRCCPRTRRGRTISTARSTRSRSCSTAASSPRPRTTRCTRSTRTTAAILWSRHLGTPMTNVTAQSGCGNVDPLGILSTPVIDTASHTIYVVATIQDSFQHIHHQLDRPRHAHRRAEGLGQRRPGRRAELAQHPAARRARARQRPRLHRLRRLRGRLRSVPRLAGVARRRRARQGRVQRHARPRASARSGRRAARPSTRTATSTSSTGNPDPDNSGNFGESVLKFDSSAAMHRTGAFKTFPGGDNDLSSVAPSILPNNMIFQIGKQQTGFLINTTNMTQLQSLHMCNGVEAVRHQRVRRLAPVRAVLEPHPGGERRRRAPDDVARLGRSRRPARPARRSSRPGSLWSIDRASGTLYVLNPANGAVRTTISVGPVAHFAAPSAALGLVLVPTLVGHHRVRRTVRRAAARARARASNAEDPHRLLGRRAPTATSSRSAARRAAVRSPACRSRSRSSAWPGASTPGYWLVARDGGIFSFGDAHVPRLDGRPAT